MGFPENILTKDEKVVRSLHPHWLTLVVPGFIALLVIAATWLIIAITPDEQTWNIVEWVVIAIALILLIALVVVPFLKWRTTHYVITTNRVAVRRGILSKSGQDIALSKITDVSFRQTLLDRIIRSGSLNIETAGDSQDEEFTNIPRSNQVQQLLNHLIEEDAARRGGYGGAAHRGYEQMAGRHSEYHQAPARTDEPRQQPQQQYDDGRYAEPAPQDRGYDGRGYDDRGYDARTRELPEDQAQDGWETPPTR